MFRAVLHRAVIASAVLSLFVTSFAFAQNADPAPNGMAVRNLAQQEGRQNAPGEFDFYVLSLSWSPSFCQEARERSADRPADPQCSAARPFAFVVHGLWPQYEQGFPSFCQRPTPRLDRATVGAMLDLMPSPHLIFHEWDRHGTCSGLSAHAFFDTVRKARSAVKIPDDYLNAMSPMTVTPGAVADAFIKANPGLSRAGLSVSCDAKRLKEVRLCLGKDLAFRDCPEVARRSCRRDTILMPALRGGREADGPKPIVSDVAAESAIVLSHH